MNKKSLIWSFLTIMVVALLSFGFVSCAKDDEEDISDPVANELRAKIIGSWIDKTGSEQYIFESSGIVNLTWFYKDGSSESCIFRFIIKKQNGYQREYYEVLMEDYGFGGGPHYEINFISDNELKLGKEISKVSQVIVHLHNLT